jgi:hypothetical protein
MVFDLEKIALNLNRTKEPQNNVGNQELFADIKTSQMNENYQVCCQAELSVCKVRKLGDFVANTIGNDLNLVLSAEKFQKSINVVDIVTINSTRTNCFTKK